MRAAAAQPAQPLSVLDVPYISQSEALCGGAAAAMVLRYWGERGVTAESFAPLLDRSAAGIRTTVLVNDLQERGWMVSAIKGSDAALGGELAAGRPVLALIEDRPGTYHYIVVVAQAERGIVFHDPARAPFRVMQRQEFERRWRAAGSWMAIVLPGAAAAAQGGGTDAVTNAAGMTPPTAGGTGPIASSEGGESCEVLIARGVASAQANDLAAAERALTRALTCPGSAASRELAGVRLLQRRWPDVSELAATAVAIDPGDSYAWQLLGTSRFVEEAPEAALEAWNRIGQPTVDLVRVDGLVRTRQRIVERALGTTIGDVLTPSRLARARRRLADVPAVLTSRVEYVPVRSGLVEVRAAVVERAVAPTPWAYAALGVAAATVKEVAYTVGSLTGGGESLTVDWRFWPRRPRVGVAFEAPAPWGGNWGVDAFLDRQPFDLPTLSRAERTAARLSASDWIAPALRVRVRGGVDAWRNTPAATYATFGGGLRWASPRDRVVATLDGDRWQGSAPFQTAESRLRWRSATERIGTVFTGTAGAGAASSAARLDLWPAGDTGHARSVTLRAHPVLTEGRLAVGRLGRGIVHASVEAQHWWRGPLASRVGIATFADTARTFRRLQGDAVTDVDVGIGARFSITLLPGTVRLDVAHGLRDGDNAVSFVFDPF